MQNKKQKESLPVMIAKTTLVIAILTGLGTIIFGGGVVIMKYYSGEMDNRPFKQLPTLCKNNFDCPLQMKCENYICVDVGCIKEGGSFPPPISPKYTNHMATKCCEDLKRITASKYYDEDCNALYLGFEGGSIDICSNCGNGICEENLETKCNCPEDCGDEIEEILYCEKDDDCAIYFSHCDCKYHCANRNIEIVDCMVDCDETGPIISECVCENNKCVDKELSTSDWQTYRNEEFGFEVKYPEYYIESKYDFDNMTEEDYDRIHFFRYMSEEELNDFKKHCVTTFEEGGTYSGTFLVKLYNNREELKKWYGIGSFKDLKFNEFKNVDYYIINKLLKKHPVNKNEQVTVGYNYIVPYREVDNLFLVFEIPEFLKLKFEKDFLSSFKFIEK